MSVQEGISDAMASGISQSQSQSSCPSASKPSLSISSASAAPSDQNSQPSLTQAINAASKPYHTHLNRTILARLPLALPPNTSDHTIYAMGIRHFLPVYHAFETAWERHVSVEPQTPTTEEFSLEEAVMLSVLIHLNLPQLARTDRLRQDVAGLLGVGLGEIDSWMIKVDGEEDVVSAEDADDSGEVPQVDLQCAVATDGEAEVDEEDPEAVQPPREPVKKTEFPALHGFVRHIHEIAEEKPHVLIAYSWVLYMALFNGGRWIRAQLSKARESWDLSLISDLEASTPNLGKHEVGLSFWHFEGAHDGDDVKDEFKARMKDVEPMLTQEQKDDIVQEAVIIFRACSRLIDELDDMIEKKMWPAKQNNSEEADQEADVGEEDESEEDGIMVRSHVLRPQWQVPWTFLQLLLNLFLPLGLWDLLMLATRHASKLSVHLPMLRWNVEDVVVVPNNE